MKLIVRLKLQTTPDDHAALLATLERANDAANGVSQHAWQTATFGQYALQKACYYDIKTHFGLTAQVVVRLIAKVSDAYKLDRKRPRLFRRHGSIAYDDRILKYFPERVSIWTVTGRRTILFVCDDRTHSAPSSPTRPGWRAFASSWSIPGTRPAPVRTAATAPKRTALANWNSSVSRAASLGWPI